MSDQVSFLRSMALLRTANHYLPLSQNWGRGRKGQEEISQKGEELETQAPHLDKPARVSKELVQSISLFNSCDPNRPTVKHLKTNLLHQAKEDNSRVVRAAAPHQATNTSSTDQKYSKREGFHSLRLDWSPTDSARRKDQNYPNMHTHTTHARKFIHIHLYYQWREILSYTVHGRTL